MTDAERDFAQKKLVVIDRIRRDGRLSASIRMIGAELFSLVNFRTGDAFASETYLAEKLCLHARTIKRAVSTLKAAGYIEVVKTGRNNRYRPIFEQAQKGTNCPLSETEKGTNCPPSGADRGHLLPGKGTKSTANRGQKVPPISLDNTLGVSGARANETVGAPDGADGSPNSSKSAAEVGLGQAGEWLRAWLGEAKFKSWFAEVTFVSVDDDRLTLTAPTRFIRDYVVAQFEGTILRAWQGQIPSLRHLTVAVRPPGGPPERSSAPAGDVPLISSRRAQRAAPDDAAWFDEAGCAIVGDRLRIDQRAAKATIVGWLRRCGFDAAGLRGIIEDAAAQQLIGDPFRNVVKQRTKALLFADQSSLALPPVIIKRRAS